MLAPYDAFAKCSFDDGDLIILAAMPAWGDDRLGCMCSGYNDFQNGAWAITKAGSKGIGHNNGDDVNKSGFPFACMCRDRNNSRYDVWDYCGTVRMCAGWDSKAMLDSYLSDYDTSGERPTATGPSPTFNLVATAVPDMKNMCWTWKCNTGYTMSETDHRCMKDCTEAGTKTSANGLDCSCGDGRIRRNGECINPCTGTDVVYADTDTEDIANKGNNACVSCPPTATQGIANGACVKCDEMTERWDQDKKVCKVFSVITNMTFADCSQYIDETDFAACATCDRASKKWDEKQKKCMAK
ncbi:hypothetical protein FACS189421_02850 [Bacteroidia bacterium]|nr:hypothetical protein FACS189421_02850 [Bacteroidia bacterium]